MAVFIINDANWAQIKDKMLSSKTIFIEHLKLMLDNDLVGQVCIYLPATATIKERHQVHKYSKKNQLSGVSATHNGKRVMKIVLESEYVRFLLGF
jgi:hypothetical protein